LQKVILKQNKKQWNADTSWFSGLKTDFDPTFGGMIAVSHSCLHESNPFKNQLLQVLIGVNPLNP